MKTYEGQCGGVFEDPEVRVSAPGAIKKALKEGFFDMGVEPPGPVLAPVVPLPQNLRFEAENCW